MVKHGLKQKGSLRASFLQALSRKFDRWSKFFIRNNMTMIQSRIKTSHTYNEEVAREIVSEISGRYFGQFMALHQTLEGLAGVPGRTTGGT